MKDKNIYILITNPKDFQFKSSRESSIKQVKYSTHIRFLIFSKYQIKNANVFIDDVYIGKAYRPNDTLIPLFLLKWNAYDYLLNVHKIRIAVEVSK